MHARRSDCVRVWLWQWFAINYLHCVWCTEGLNSYVRSLPAAAAKKLRKTRSLLAEMHRPATEKQQSRLNNRRLSSEADDKDTVIRCSQCGGIELIVVNGVERQLKGDVICACAYDPELPQHSGDLDAAASCPNDDQLASTSTPY